METLGQEVKTRRKVDSRVGEMVLVILGGVFGLMAGGFVASAGGLFAAFHDDRATLVVWRDVAAILISVVVLVLLSFLSSHSRLAGWLLIAAMVGGVLAAGYFYFLPGLLLLIAGLMCLLRGRKTVAMSW